MRHLFLFLVTTFSLLQETYGQNGEKLISLDAAAFKKIITPGKHNLGINPFLKEITALSENQSIPDSVVYFSLNAWNKYPVPKRTGVICEYFLKLDTNYTVPYLVYIPKNYNATLKTTLLVYYKGGWLSRKEFPPDYAKEIVKDNPTFEYLDENNIIEIFPILETKLAIYGNYGYEHLQKMISETKKR